MLQKVRMRSRLVEILAWGKEVSNALLNAQLVAHLHSHHRGWPQSY